MISTPGSLSFAKLVMMSSAPAKSAGDARYVSQDPFIHSISMLSHTISTPICIRSVFFLHRMQRSNVPQQDFWIPDLERSIFIQHVSLEQVPDHPPFM